MSGRPDVERLLREAFEEEARGAMAATDTTRELERFRERTEHERRRRRAVTGLAAAAAVLVAGGITAVVITSDDADRPVGEVAAPVEVDPAADGTFPYPAQEVPEGVVTQVLEGFNRPVQVLADTDARWVVDSFAGEVVRLSPDGTQELSRSPYGDDNRIVVLGATATEQVLLVPLVAAEAVEGTGPQGEGYVRVDRGTGAVLGVLATDRSGEVRTPGDPDLGTWMVVGERQVGRVSPDGSRVELTFDLDGPVAAVAVGADGVWVADRDARTVTRLDPVDGRVTATVTLPGVPEVLVATDDAVFVADDQARLTRIDRDGESTVSVRAEGAPEFRAPVTAATDGTDVWLGTRGGAVTWFDGATLDVRAQGLLPIDRTIEVNSGPGSYAVAGGVGSFEDFAGSRVLVFDARLGAGD